MKHFLLSALSALALAGCATVGPDYRSPAPGAPAQEPFLSGPAARRR